MKSVITKEEQYIEKMKSVLDIVEKLTDPSQGLSLGQVAQMFTNLQVIYENPNNFIFFSNELFLGKSL